MQLHQRSVATSSLFTTFLRKYAAPVRPMEPTNPTNSPLCSSSSSFGDPHRATVRLSNTMIRSKFANVSRRCAMDWMVACFQCCLIVCSIKRFVSISSELLASSKMRIFELRSSALVKQMICRCPAERISPYFETGAPSPSSNADTNCLRCDLSNASNNCGLENYSNGSRFIRTVPLNITGS